MRVDRAALHLPRPPGRSVLLRELEAVAVRPRLGHDEEAQPAVGLGAVGVGAGEQHQDVGAGAERAPRLDAVDHVARPAVDALGRRRRDLQPGDVAAVVGLGDGDGGHHLGRRQLRQPRQLLLLGAALDQRPRQDLRAGDQRSADAQAGSAQLLGGDDHGQVLAVAALVVAAVLGRHRQPEGADLGQAGDDLLGHVGVRAMDVLGLRGDDVGGERAERVLDQLHVGVEVARARRLGERGDELRVAEALEERVRLAQRRRLDAPQPLPAGEAGDQVVHDVGGEGARDARLDVALGAVVEQRPRRRRGRRGVGEVVGDDLLGVGTTASAQRGGQRWRPRRRRGRRRRPPRTGRSSAQRVRHARGRYRAAATALSVRRAEPDVRRRTTRSARRSGRVQRGVQAAPVARPAGGPRRRRSGCGG